MTRKAWVCLAALLALVPGSTCRKADVQGGRMDVANAFKPNFS